MSRYVAEQVRRAVHERARGLCEYCYCSMFFSPDPFEVEHIVPVVRGGPTQLANLALSCRGCNLGKSDKVTAQDKATESIVPLFNPRFHLWAEHFVWGNDYTLIVGLTPTGRATVATLRLNRPEVVNLRRVLRLVGEHPPDVEIFL